MKERPILMSSPMVRAILAGTKTQTRRVVQIPRRGAFVVLDHGEGWWPYQSDCGESALCNDGNEHPMGCPYGMPGDRLWVRETCIIADKDFPDFRDPSWPKDNEGVPRVVQYLATTPDRTHAADYGYTKATPSIHMPRWASRITLEVTGVRVERLQDISEDDACAEGMGSRITRDCKVPKFARLWDEINGKRAPWASNPWVWVVSFQRVG